MHVYARVRACMCVHRYHGAFVEVKAQLSASVLTSYLVESGSVLLALHCAENSRLASPKLLANSSVSASHLQVYATTSGFLWTLSGNRTQIIRLA